MQMSDELSRCLVLNTIAAARTLLRRFDGQLKPFGVTVQQFSLLAAVRSHPGEPVMALAQHILMDRTSLTRNLDLLERKGLVRRLAGVKGNARLCELTEAGDTVLDRLLPEWQRVGSEFNNDIPEQDAETYRRVAARLMRE
jgi:DNA-binding MarR family transcriptional regulator